MIAPAPRGRSAPTLDRAPGPPARTSTRPGAALRGEARQVALDRGLAGRESEGRAPVASGGRAALELEVAGVAAVDERGEVARIRREPLVERAQQAVVLPEVAVAEQGRVEAEAEPLVHGEGVGGDALERGEPRVEMGREVEARHWRRSDPHPAHRLVESRADERVAARREVHVVV